MQEYNLVSDRSESNTFWVFQVHRWLRHGTLHISCCRALLPMLFEGLLWPVAHAKVWVVSPLKNFVEQLPSPIKIFAYRNNQLIRWKKCTASISRTSKTRDQSLVESLKALHGIFLKTRPSRRTVVIGPYNLSPDEVKRSIAYTW